MLLLLVLALALALGAAPATNAAAVPDAWVPASGRPVIIPEPQSLRWLPAPFPLADTTRIVVGDEAGPEDLYAVRDLNEEIRARTGRVLSVVRAAAAGELHDAIVLGEPALNAASAALLGREGLRVSGTDPGAEGYVLKVMPGTIVAAGADRRGTFYAVQTLRQLLTTDRGRMVFPGVEVRDWPVHHVRAVHILLDNASDEFHVALIDRILSKFKINTVIMEAEYVRWESARNLWQPSGATKDEVAKVIQAAREHHMEVIPLIQTLGHVEWLYANNQNLDLLEIPPEQSNARYVYNPLNARVYDVTFAILDEAIKLFQPRYLHIGHDEVRNVVPFPWSAEGKRLGFGELFVRDTVRYYQFLNSRQVGTMMWGDVLLTNDFAPEINRLPKEVVMVDWQYHEASRYPSLARFARWGFPTIAATWWKPKNIQGFALEAQQQRILGMLRTTWTGHFGNRTVLERQYQQIYTYLTAADNFWKPRVATRRSQGTPAAAPESYEPAARFRQEWEGTPKRATPAPGVVLDLSGAATRSHVDEDGRGWVGKGREYDLRRLPTGRRRFNGILFAIADPTRSRGRSIIMLRGKREELRALPQKVRLPVRQRAAVVAVLHATPFAAGRFGEDVGAYTIRYEDGSQEVVPIQYRRNIGSWLDEPISMQQEVAWSGRTLSDLDVRLSLLRWTNPHPGKVIESIEFASTGTDAAPAIFGVTLLSEQVE